jgi:hypothetical protein
MMSDKSQQPMATEPTDYCFVNKQWLQPVFPA